MRAGFHDSTDLEATSQDLPLLVRCMDIRYCDGLVRQKLPLAFELTDAGASLQLVRSPHFRLKVVKRFHFLREEGLATRRIIIADHYARDPICGHGCAAYGENDSLARHVRNLRKAAALLKDMVSEAEIDLFLHDIDAGTVELISLTMPGAPDHLYEPRPDMERHPVV